VIMRAASNRQTALQFLALLKTAETRATLRRYGFDVPSAAPSR
jgi:ABC-type molybdate transport system substrate-binding protein